MLDDLRARVEFAQAGSIAGAAELLEERREGTSPIGKDAPALVVMPGSLLTPFNARSADRVTAEIHRQKNQGAD